MVGTKTGIAEMTAKYVGRPFAECTCMRLVHSWYRDLGVDLPDRFGELTLDNYLAAWNSDKKRTLATMVELFLILGQPVEDLNAIRRHDLLAVEEEGNLYAAIALGGKLAITSNYHNGVRVFFLGDRHRVILARRMISAELNQTYNISISAIDGNSFLNLVNKESESIISAVDNAAKGKV